MTNLADQLAYRYEIEGNIKLKEICNTIVTQLCIFSAYFHYQIGKYFSNTPVTTLDCSALSDDYSERKAWRVLQEIQDYINNYSIEIAGLQQGEVFLGQRKHCYEILQEAFVVEKKTYNDSRYLSFHAPAYHVTHDDFVESLPVAEYSWIKSKSKLAHRERNDPSVDNGLLRTSQ
jgi:hypothetical protein